MGRGRRGEVDGGVERRIIRFLLFSPSVSRQPEMRYYITFIQNKKEGVLEGEKVGEGEEERVCEKGGVSGRGGEEGGEGWVES